MQRRSVAAQLHLIESNRIESTFVFFRFEIYLHEKNVFQRLDTARQRHQTGDETVETTESFPGARTTTVRRRVQHVLNVSAADRGAKKIQNDAKVFVTRIGQLMKVVG